MTHEAESARGEKGAAVRPLILFDGVCNLCNAWVQWILERDKRGVFRLASLQSEAASTALAAAQPSVSAEQLPDGVVLVDEDGLHTQSEAALRVARRLGLPYSLIALAIVVPRPLRDAVYRLVARNRYRWFGRRSVCMTPTPELAARFLDADEPRSLVPESPEPEVPRGSGAGASSGLAAWLTRLGIAYVVVYMAPFPLTLLRYLGSLPWIGDLPALSTALEWLLGLPGRVMTPLVSQVGRTLFDVEAELGFTGSGDQTFHYLDLLVDLVLAFVLSVGWTLAARARPVSPRSWDAARVLARYYLATTMLSYGWIKLFPLQFSTPGADRLIQSYGDSSPMGLAWTFLGASVGYQMFMGFSELVGGYLLFWRRTTLIGALVASAVLVNVVAINFFFDIPVKLFSAHLFLMAVFIMAPDLPRLAGLLAFNLPVARSQSVRFWTSKAGGRQLALVHLVFVSALTAQHVSGNLEASRNRGALAPVHPLAGIYRVESFQRAGLSGAQIADEQRWVRVGLNPPYTATIQTASGDSVRVRLALDEQASTLSVFDRGGSAPQVPDFTWRESEPGVLRLEGSYQGQPTEVIMRRDHAAPLLTGRGFHWINEYPFNR